MNNKQLMILLQSSKTEYDKDRKNEPRDLLFQIEDNEANRSLFNETDIREYNASEVAGLIAQLDVEELSENEMAFIRSFYQRLVSDNRSENLYTNEELLVGPLQQKIQEYELLVQQRGFDSNKNALEAIQKHNANLSAIKMINLKSYETDSNYDLDYLTITKEDGSFEMVTVPDPDYLERFTNEFANEISHMSADEFINIIKNSTDTKLDFVKLEDYITNKEIQTKMHSPAVKDNNILADEMKQAKELVDKFLPNTEIFISIDKNGEIFYKAEDGIIKGETHDGKRTVRFIQVPSKFRENAYAQANEEKLDDISKNENYDNNVKQPEEKEVGDIEVKVTFNKQRFNDLFEMRDIIIHGDDPDLKQELFNQLNALFDLCYVQEVSPNLKQCLFVYLQERYPEYENMQHDENIVKDNKMDLQEFNLLQKFDEAYRQSRLVEVKEEVEEEVDTYGISGDTKNKPKVRSKVFPNKPNGLSIVAILFEIVTIALLVLLLLSLDI